jgi:ABC-2 type transport system permease protein
MMSQTQAELLKIRTTRTTVGLLLGLVALELLVTLLTGLVGSSKFLLTEQDQNNLFGNGGLAGVFAALAGIMLVTSEYRFGTIRPTFLVTPIRSRVLWAKVAAGTVAGLLFGIVGESLALAIGLIILKARHVPLSYSAANFTLLICGTLAGVALWGALGVGLGAIVKNQVGGVVLLLAWGFVAENLLFHALPSIGRFLPVHDLLSMTGSTGAHFLTPGAATATLILWAVALSYSGLLMWQRRDVT